MKASTNYAQQKQAPVFTIHSNTLRKQISMVPCFRFVWFRSNIKRERESFANVYCSLDSLSQKAKSIARILLLLSLSFLLYLLAENKSQIFS